MPEVQGVEKELGPHLQPEQQYVSKGVKSMMPKSTTPKRTTPKRVLRVTLKRVDEDSLQETKHKEKPQNNIDNVNEVLLPDTRQVSRTPADHDCGTPLRSPKPQVKFTTPTIMNTRQREKINGDSAEKSIEDQQLENNLKYTQ